MNEMSPPWPPNGVEASLALTLMERYHEAAQHLRWLASAQKAEGGMWQERVAVEAHRVKATRIFNALYGLVQGRLISPDMFCLVLPRSGAHLWLTHVLPLDQAVANAGAARDGLGSWSGPSDMEMFYSKYATTGMLLLRVPAPQPTVTN